MYAWTVTASRSITFNQASQAQAAVVTGERAFVGARLVEAVPCSTKQTLFVATAWGARGLSVGFDVQGTRCGGLGAAACGGLGSGV